MDFQQLFNALVENYGIYAVFFLCMVEGDITLLLSGALARTGSFGDYGYLRVLAVGTSGAVFGDFCGYMIGRLFRKNVSNFSYYRAAQPRIESLTEKFGPLSIFVSKYIYGIRAAWCIFYGVSGTPWWKFLLFDTISCFLWVSILSGVGYLFSGAVSGIIGEFHRVGIFLLIVLVLGVIGFYWLERYWLSKKVEEVDKEKIQKIEQAAHTTLHDVSGVFHEKFNLGGNNLNGNNNAAGAPHEENVLQPAQTNEPRKAENFNEYE